MKGSGENGRMKKPTNKLVQRLRTVGPAKKEVVHSDDSRRKVKQWRLKTLFSGQIMNIGISLPF